MKIKTKLKSWALFVASLIMVGSSLGSAFTVLLPATSDATQPTSAAIVNDTDDQYSQTIPPGILNHNGGYECKANIVGPAVLNSPDKQNILEEIAARNGNTNPLSAINNFLYNVEGASSAAKATFNNVANGHGMFEILFNGANNNDNNDNACIYQSMMLFRDATLSKGESSTTFYGLWDTGHYADGNLDSRQKWVAITATVNPDGNNGGGTVKFTLPSGNYRKGSFNLNISGGKSIFSNDVWFPPASGGGSGGTGGSTDSNCFDSVTSGDGLNKCISQAGTGDFTDAAQIVYGGDTYTATEWGGNPNNMTYKLTSSPDKHRLDGGTSELILDTTNSASDINLDHDKGSQGENDGLAKALKGADGTGEKLKLSFHNISSDSTEHDGSVEITAQGLVSFAAYYPKDDTVRLVFAKAGGNESAYFGTYSRKGSSNVFQLADSNWGGDCSNFANIDFGKNDPKHPPVAYNGSSPETVTMLSADWNLNAHNGPCSVTDVHINVPLEPASTDPPGGSTTSGVGSSPEINCSVSLFNPLSWFLCPLATALETVVSGLDDEINNYLDIAPGKSSYGSSCPTSADKWCGYYQAWSVVRNISLGLIAVFALVAIVSQAMGFELLDAYTIRKVLPRLLVAAIGMTLSWPLMMWFINLTNDLGVGVRQIIYAPFTQYKVELGGGGQFVSSFFAAGAIVALGFAGLLSFVATAALAAAVAFLVLTLRQMLIVMLVIFAPIAIACYVLPNTQKVWKLWGDSFTKGLLMFPIIAGFIAIGRVFAAVNSTGTGSINQIISFTAYFAPYFLIPFTFRLAGGAVSTIAGLANDRSKGMFDRLKKGRSERMADRFQRAQNQSLWDNSSKVGKVANKVASWGTDPLSNAAYYGRDIPGLRKRGNKIASALEHQAGEQSGKLFEEINKMGFNDKAYRALSGQHGDLSAATRKKLEDANLLDKAPTSLGQLEQMADILQQSESETERIGGNAIHGSMGRLSTLYQDPEMGRASIQAAGIMGLAAHGFASGEDIAGAANGLAATHGSAFAQTVASQAQLLGQRSRPDVKPGYGVMYDPSTGKFRDGSAQGERDLDLIQTLNAHDVAGAKGGFLDNMHDSYQEIFTADDTRAQQHNAAVAAITHSDPQEQKRLRSEYVKAHKADARNAKASSMKQAVKDQIFQWAGPYSQASVDVKAQALGMVGEFGFQEDFDKYRRAETDPTVRGQGGGGDEGDNQPPLPFGGQG